MADFIFDGQTGFYAGKVRNVYSIQNDLIVLIASDRLSAFDVILPRAIPFKGQVLNEIAAYMLGQCRDICPNWLLDVPAPTASVGKKCVPFELEIVVRGNLTGHAWRTYKSGLRTLCGVPLPEGMKENDFFPDPVITPSTKSHTGHDEDISAVEIMLKELASESEWNIIKKYALQLFERGKKIAQSRGLILADTKYEFGKIGEVIYLMDEIHTPDSSRFFYAEGFFERLKTGEKQKQLSKEFVREWLMDNGFMGQADEKIPLMTDEITGGISRRYRELYEKITGQPFIPKPLSDENLFEKINLSLKELQNSFM